MEIDNWYKERLMDKERRRKMTDDQIEKERNDIYDEVYLFAVNYLKPNYSFEDKECDALAIKAANLLEDNLLKTGVDGYR